MTHPHFIITSKARQDEVSKSVKILKHDIVHQIKLSEFYSWQLAQDSEGNVYLFATKQKEKTSATAKN